MFDGSCCSIIRSSEQEMQASSTEHNNHNHKTAKHNQHMTNTYLLKLLHHNSLIYIYK